MSKRHMSDEEMEWAIASLRDVRLVRRDDPRYLHDSLGYAYPKLEPSPEVAEAMRYFRDALASLPPIEGHT